MSGGGDVPASVQAAISRAAGAGVGTSWLLHGLAGRTYVGLTTVEVDPAVAALTDTGSWPSWAHLAIDDAVALTRRSGAFDRLLAHPELVSVELACSTGLLLCARKHS